MRETPSSRRRGRRRLPKIALVSLALGILASSCADDGRADRQRRLEQRMATLDQDQDGRISEAEFAARGTQGGPEFSAVRFRILDFDADGSLNAEELESGEGEGRGAAQRRPGARAERRLQRGGLRPALHLGRYDADGDGHLTRREFDQGFDGEDAPRALRRFTQLDADTNGVVDPDELRAARRAGRGRGRGGP